MRELDNMTNPIKTGQIVLGLKIRGFETCDFSFYVITPKSKDIAVKDFFLVCLHTHTHRQKDSRHLQEMNIDL